jgi:hypothetical protein
MRARHMLYSVLMQTSCKQTVDVQVQHACTQPLSCVVSGEVTYCASTHYEQQVLPCVRYTLST